LKKRSKKLLIFGTLAGLRGALVLKVFWFFFSKKNALLSLPTSYTPRGGSRPPTGALLF
jgi:hypothetical protein